MKTFYSLISNLLGVSICVASVLFAADVASQDSELCSLQVSNQTPYSTSGYDPLSQQDYSEKLSFRVRNIGQSVCSGRLQFISGLGDGAFSNGEAEQLQFALFDNTSGGQLLYESETDRVNDLGLNLLPGQTVFFEPYIVVPRGQKGASGGYNSNLDIAFAPGSFEPPTDYFDGNLQLSVRANVQANFTGVDRSTGNGDWSFVNLGELSPGKRHGFGLQIRSNSDVDVEISSLNSGQLGHETRPEDTIKYNFKIGGHDLDLSGQQEVTLPANVNQDGSTSPVEIELENYANKPAGSYSDTIRVRISAR